MQQTNQLIDHQDSGANINARKVLGSTRSSIRGLLAWVGSLRQVEPAALTLQPSHSSPHSTPHALTRPRPHAPSLAERPPPSRSRRHISRPHSALLALTLLPQTQAPPPTRPPSHSASLRIPDLESSNNIHSPRLTTASHLSSPA